MSIQFSLLWCEMCIEWRLELTLDSFIHEDGKYNYVSGRFPPDAEVLAKRCVELVRGVYQS